MGLVHHNITPCIKSWRLASWRRDSIFRASSRVAQLVEQPAVNRRVAGSSPASGAILPSPPTGGGGAVNRSPARQLAGLRLESASVRGVLREGGAARAWPDAGAIVLSEGPSRSRAAESG